MVDLPSLGRRKSLAYSTFATAFGCVLFAISKQSWAIRLSSMFISLAATTMWAILYVSSSLHLQVSLLTCAT
jgi:hypothetical protein